MNILLVGFAVAAIIAVTAMVGCIIAYVVKDAIRELKKVDPESTEACMEWVNLQRSKAVNINDEEWDEKYLHATVEKYWKYPLANYADVEAAKNVTETLNWLKENDPSAMRARIAELERELGIR